jgi:hypothetical protein
MRSYRLNDWLIKYPIHRLAARSLQKLAELGVGVVTVRAAVSRFMPKAGLVTLALGSHLGAISDCASSDSWLSWF